MALYCASNLINSLMSFFDLPTYGETMPDFFVIYNTYRLDGFYLCIQ
jgi:hypothetical protein